MNKVTHPLPTLCDLKSQARKLRENLHETQTPISHSRALEIIACQYGYRDWNTLHAAAGNQHRHTPYIPGQEINGKYLGQEFSGEIIGVTKCSGGERYKLSIQLNEPVDVVTFDSFSAYRQRLQCTVNRNGLSSEKTSNGLHQMALNV